MAAAATASIDTLTIKEQRQAGKGHYFLLRAVYIWVSRGEAPSQTKGLSLNSRVRQIESRLAILIVRELSSARTEKVDLNIIQGWLMSVK